MVVNITLLVAVNIRILLSNCFLKILSKVVSIFDLHQGNSYEQDEVGGDGVLVSQVTKDSAGGGGGGGDESIGK